MQVQVPARLGTTPALCAQCEGGGADGLGFGFSGFAVLPSCLTRWQNGSSLHPGMERSRCSTGVSSRERLCQCQVRKVLSIFLSLQVRDVGSLLLRANLACLQRDSKFIQFLFLSCQVPLPPAPHLVHGRGAVPKWRFHGPAKNAPVKHRCQAAVLRWSRGSTGAQKGAKLVGTAVTATCVLQHFESIFGRNELDMFDLHIRLQRYLSQSFTQFQGLKAKQLWRARCDDLSLQQEWNTRHCPSGLEWYLAPSGSMCGLPKIIHVCHFASISGPGFSSKDGEERWRGGGLSDLFQLDLKTWMRISKHPPGETYPDEGLWICGAGRAASNYGPIGRNLTKVSEPKSLFCRLMG